MEFEAWLMLSPPKYFAFPLQSRLWSFSLIKSYLSYHRILPIDFAAVDRAIDDLLAMGARRYLGNVSCFVCFFAILVSTLHRSISLNS